MKTKICLGTTSEHKLSATRAAAARANIQCEIAGVKSSSGVNEQPVGLDETLKGAKNRALAAREACPDGVAIGIESGIFRSPELTLDIAVIVALVPDGREIITTSPGMPFPEDLVVEAERRGFATTTVGSLIAESRGGDPTDPHATLTDDKLTRHDTLVAGLLAALVQI